MILTSKKVGEWCQSLKMMREELLSAHYTFEIHAYTLAAIESLDEACKKFTFFRRRMKAYETENGCNE